MSAEQPVKYILPHGWVVQVKLDPDTHKTIIQFKHKDATRVSSGEVTIEQLVRGVEFDVDAAFDVALGVRERVMNGRLLPLPPPPPKP